MDIYVICDFIAVVVAAAVWFKSRSTESLLLTLFFATSSILSFSIQEISKYTSLDLAEFWIVSFSAIILFFTLASSNPKIKLAYIAQCIALGTYLIYGFELYPVAIYGLFATQLWVSSNAGSNRGRRSRDIPYRAPV